MKQTFTIATIGKPDGNGDIILPDSIIIKNPVKITRDFNHYVPPVSIADGIFIENDELKATAEIPEELQELKAGIAFQVIESDVKDDGTRVIKKMNLYEVSLLTTPVSTKPF